MRHTAASPFLRTASLLPVHPPAGCSRHGRDVTCQAVPSNENRRPHPHGLRAAAPPLAEQMAAATLQAFLPLASIVPGMPPGPAGDIALDFLRNPLAFLEESAALYGGASAFSLAGRQIVLITDPGLAREVLVGQSDSFQKRGTAFFPGSRLAGNGLLVSDGETWRRQRQLSSPAFRQQAVTTYTQAMVEATRHMLRDQWRCGGRRDVYADFNALTLRITTDALFGTDLPLQQASEVTGAIQTAFGYFVSRSGPALLVPEWLPTPGNLAYSAAVARLDAVVYGIIDAQAARCAAPGAAAKCLLDALSTARDEAGRGMTRGALRDELMTLLVAGQETSAILLAWACAFLAHYPPAQVRARKGLEAAPGGLGGGSQFLEAVLLETMRLRPPAYIVGRCAAREVALPGCRLPEGTTVLVSPYVMHRLPSHWPDAQAFKPERWLPLLQGRSAMVLLSGLGPNGAYLPFGSGPRNCIGTGFAMVEAVLVLSAILREFHLAPVPGTTFPKAVAQITLRPEKVDIILTARQIAGDDFFVPS